MRADNSVLCSILSPKTDYFNPLSYCKNNADIEIGLENMWKLENLGLRETDDLGSIDEVKINKLRDTLEFKDGHYLIELPWYDDLIDKVPSNYHIALSTLNRVLKNLVSRGLTEKYDAVFKQQLEDGIIERLIYNPSDHSKYVWLPHRPIIKEAEQCTTKVRPVFNCSLKINTLPSLNEASYPGVDLLSSLFRLLCGFRANKYVLLSDIKQAFLNIKLKLEADRNRFCFLWVEHNKIIAYRYKTIVFGLSASPFILNFVVKHHLLNYANDICTQTLKNNLYVDNLVYTHDDLNILMYIYDTSVRRLQEGGFELRSWTSNSAALNNKFQADERGVFHSKNVERVLGYSYNLIEDTLSLNEFDISSCQLTKRKLLSQTSKVFDPLSLYLPVTVKGRILMRQTWQKQMGWDDNLPDDLNKLASAHFIDLKKLHQISFPRMTFSESEENLSLNIFCDASSSCYGFVVYVNNKNKNNILLAKAKVAPLNGRTLPTLELLSVFLAFKHLPQILSSFHVTFKSINFFVDAQIVLSWLLSGKVKTKQVFVRNRVQDIQQMMSDIKKNFHVECKYFYVATGENPADYITRGLTYKEFEDALEFWRHGPSWLLHDIRSWPKTDLGCLSESSKILTQSSVLASQILASNTLNSLDCIVNLSKFSNVSKLERVVSYVFKFINLCCKKTVDCARLAKLYLIKYIQNHHFHNEISFLKCESKSNLPIPNLVKNLDLFIDDEGIVRSKGRISKVNFYNYEILNPILLPKNDNFTHMIIRRAHFTCKHMGLQSTLNKVRLQGYWIPCARQVVKTVLSDCIICKKYNNFAFAYPKFTSFTKAQTDFVRPYKHVGVDLTGNVWVKSPDNSVNTKMYIIIYTCLNVRAIHIELLPDMTTKSFILSFKRFSNLYGICDTIYSDNAKYFSQGAKAFQEFLLSDEFSDHLRSSNIKHVKIPIFASWVGSLWERMIRVVKSCMYKAIGRSILNYFEMITLLSSIQNSVNSRPLTYVASGDEFAPLTPNSFFKYYDESSIELKTLGSDSDDPIWETGPTSRNQLILSLDKINSKFDHFKSLWFDEYLLSLRERSRDLFQTEWFDKIDLGDIVLIKHPSKTRPHWQMGIVTQLLWGNDNKVRFVRLRKADGHTDVYSIKLLYPLEIHAKQMSSAKTDSSKVECVVDSNKKPNTRSKRGAAEKAKRAIERIFSSE